MVRITQEQLLKEIKQIGNPATFDPVVKGVASQSIRRLVLNTPKDTGNLRRGWTNIRKLAQAKYTTNNDIQTQPNKTGKRWNIARLFNDGTKTLTKSKGFFYIPLSRKGKNKRLGARITKDLKFGIDFVLTKRRRGIKATKFIDEEINKADLELFKAVTKKVDEILR